MSDIASRSEISIKSKIGDYSLDIPLIAAPMKDVVNTRSAKAIMESGAYAILHRFQSVSDIVASWNCLPKETAVSIGIQPEDRERFDKFYKEGIRYFCIDIANGGNVNIQKFVTSIPQRDVFFILGNIGHPDIFNALDRFDDRVVGIRAGIAFGAGCTTKNATGVASPMVDLLQSLPHGDNMANIIADGGVKEPQDFCKAIALGADQVMAGSVFAKCSDSAAPLDPSGVYKLYRGSASSEIQQHYRAVPKYIEGRSVQLESSEETISEMINRYSEGLRSSMSYFGARDIEQFQNYSNFSYES